jgi:hypothetical protein
MKTHFDQHDGEVCGISSQYQTWVSYSDGSVDVSTWNINGYVTQRQDLILHQSLPHPFEVQESSGTVTCYWLVIESRESAP